MEIFVGNYAREKMTKVERRFRTLFGPKMNGPSPAIFGRTSGQVPSRDGQVLRPDRGVRRGRAYGVPDKARRGGQGGAASAGQGACHVPSLLRYCSVSATSLPRWCSGCWTRREPRATATATVAATPYCHASLPRVTATRHCTPVATRQAVPGMMRVLLKWVRREPQATRR